MSVWSFYRIFRSNAVTPAAGVWYRDVMCGMLHCQHLSEKLMFWKEALAFTMPEAWVLVNNTRYDCKAAILDVGLSMPDPGMVPDGAKCAEQHVSIGPAEIAWLIAQSVAKKIWRLNRIN